MRLLTENERLMASVILIFIVYFGLDSLLSLVIGDATSLLRGRLTFSFVVGMAAGILFYLYSRRSAPAPDGEPLARSMMILKKALTDDEMLLISIVTDTPGVTQDSLRFRTEFSKSKVSALIVNLEKKGIIQREKTGKTYKIFLSESLK